MLHDLVLCIGGMTVAELRERMSVSELADWIAYSEIVGPLNPLLRLDAAVARALAPFVKKTVRECMPWPKQPEQEATLEDLMLMLKPATKKL